MRISALKPVVVDFLEAGYRRLKDDPALVRSAWRNAGFSKTHDKDFQRFAATEMLEGRLFPPGFVAVPSVDDGDEQPGKYDALPDEDDMVALADLRDKIDAAKAAAPALAAAMAAAAGASRAAAAAAGLAAASGSGVAPAAASGSGTAGAAGGSGAVKRGRGRPPKVSSAAPARAVAARKRTVKQPVQARVESESEDSAESSESNDSSSGASSGGTSSGGD